MAGERGQHVIKRDREFRLDLVFAVGLGLAAALGTNRLTGITAVDIVERFGLGIAVGLATWKHGVAQRVAGPLALAAALFAPSTQGLAGLFLGAGIAGIGVLLIIDRVGRRVLRYGLLLAILLLAPAIALGLSAKGSIENAQTKVESLRSDLTSSDSKLAARNIDSALHDVRRAKRRLSNPVTNLARVVPFASQQVAATRTLLSVVEDVAAAAQRSIEAIDIGSLKLDNGRIPIEGISKLRAPASRLATASVRAKEQADEVRLGSLVPQLRTAAEKIRAEAANTAHTSEVLADIARQAPSLFGLNGPRRYFLLIQNPAEARASGGILAAYAEVAIDHGHMRLTQVGRDSDLNRLSGDRPRETTPGFERYRRIQPKRFWPNFTASPDFPTVAEAVRAEYAPIGTTVDGVISIDPPALAALLKILGPVTVADWPEPLTSENIVRVIEHDEYVHFTDIMESPRRDNFIANAVFAIWSELTTASPALDNIDALGDAVSDGHLYMWASREDEQALFEKSGVSGAFPKFDGDTLAVTSQNASMDKTDWFMTRSVDYRPRIQGHRFSATLTVTLRNDTPSSGEPQYVAGPNDPAIEKAHNRTYLSIYTPWDLVDATTDAATTVVSTDSELGLNVYAVEVDTPPDGGSTTVTLRLSGTWDRGRYLLAYRPQPLVKGDKLEGLSPASRTSVVIGESFRQSAAIRWYSLRGN